MIVKSKKGGKTYNVSDSCPQKIVVLLETKGIKKVSFEYFIKNEMFFPSTKTIKIVGKCELCEKQTENY